MASFPDVLPALAAGKVLECQGVQYRLDGGELQKRYPTPAAWSAWTAAEIMLRTAIGAQWEVVPEEPAKPIPTCSGCGEHPSAVYCKKCCPHEGEFTFASTWENLRKAQETISRLEHDLEHARQSIVDERTKRERLERELSEAPQMLKETTMVLEDLWLQVESFPWDDTRKSVRKTLLVAKAIVNPAICPGWCPGGDGETCGKPCVLDAKHDGRCSHRRPQ